MYTLKEYEQDKRIAELTFNKCFGKHYLKDELIHVAVIKLWEVRLEHGKLKDYFLQAFQIAKRAMFTHLRKERRHCFHDNLTDEIYTKVYFTSNVPLDTLYSNIKFDEPKTYEAFLRRIHNVYNFDDPIQKQKFMAGEPNANPHNIAQMQMIPVTDDNMPF